MKCKSKFCDMESGHKGKCQRLTGAINTESAINSAINREASSSDPDMVVRPPTETPAVLGAAQVAVDSRTKNRRMKSAYNEYMRDYMRKRRAKAG